MADSVINESFELARQIRAENSWSYRLISFCWSQSFRLTRLLEKYLKPYANALLNNNGVLVISFSDIGNVLSGCLCQGHETTSANVNALISRHGHCFMCCTDSVVALLKSAGFEDVCYVKLVDLSLMHFIGLGRADESSYVVAKCRGSANL